MYANSNRNIKQSPDDKREINSGAYNLEWAIPDEKLGKLKKHCGAAQLGGTDIIERSSNALIFSQKKYFHALFSLPQHICLKAVASPMLHRNTCGVARRLPSHLPSMASKLFKLKVISPSWQVLHWVIQAFCC